MIENTKWGGTDKERRGGSGEDGEERPTTHGRLAETRRTGTPPMHLEELTEEEFEEMIDLFGYGVPLWGMLMGTGDETPVWPWIFAGIGVIALILIPIIGRRRKKGNR